MSKARANAETLRTALVAGDVTNANFTGADLEVGKGGTGASSAGAARTALGVVIGTNVLAPDGDGSALTGISALPSQSSQSGKFLTTNGSAASWGTVAGAGMVLLSTVTASNSSTVDIETTFDGTYGSYMIIASNVRSSSDGGLLRAIMKLGGSYVTSSSYNYHQIRTSSGSNNYLGTGYTTQIAIEVNDGIGNASTHSAGFTMSIDDPTSTTLYKKIHWEGSRVVAGGAKNAGFTSGVGVNIGSTAALTGIRFFIQSATTSGTFRLYGIAK